MIRLLINAGVDGNDGICNLPLQLVLLSHEYECRPYASSSSRSSENASRPFPLYPKSGDVCEVAELRSAELVDRSFDEVDDERETIAPLICGREIVEGINNGPSRVSKNVGDDVEHAELPRDAKDRFLVSA